MAVIGITWCKRLDDYVESIRRAGGEPRVLSLEAPPSLHGLDGLLFTGGGDIDPARYGESRHPNTQPPDPSRDAFELELARLAIDQDVPTLAICRGMQVVNVSGGGTLIQDIPSEVRESLAHSVETPHPAIAHDTRVTRGSLLSDIMRGQLARGEVLPVNSRHHQAIRQAASGFDICAIAPDGIVEAMERPGARFCLAVQWHPESFWSTGAFQPLFDALVSASTRSVAGSR